MTELLAEERAAIGRLDGSRVNELATEKLALAQALEQRPASERLTRATDMKKLARDLRTNGVLLAQARAILGQLLFGRSARAVGGAGRFVPATRTPQRLSVRV
jgi:hypothetical protein